MNDKMKLFESHLREDERLKILLISICEILRSFIIGSKGRTLVGVSPRLYGASPRL